MQQQAASDGVWIDWFTGIGNGKRPSKISADEFLPDLLRRSRRLKAEMMYINSFIGA